MLVDVILFDFAVDSFYGQFATSSGRITAGSIRSADSSMTTIAALAWGQGKFTTTSNMGSAIPSWNWRNNSNRALSIISIDTYPLESIRKPAQTPVSGVSFAPEDGG